MSAFTDILKGERGTFGLLLVVAASVFVGIGKITFAEWQDYTLWIFGMFVCGKTVTTSFGLIAGRNAPEPATAPAPAAPAAPAPALVPPPA